MLKKFLSILLLIIFLNFGFYNNVRASKIKNWKDIKIEVDSDGNNIISEMTTENAGEMMEIIKNVGKFKNKKEAKNWKKVYEAFLYTNRLPLKGNINLDLNSLIEINDEANKLIELEDNKTDNNSKNNETDNNSGNNENKYSKKSFKDIDLKTYEEVNNESDFLKLYDTLVLSDDEIINLTNNDLESYSKRLKALRDKTGLVSNSQIYIDKIDVFMSKIMQLRSESVEESESLKNDLSDTGNFENDDVLYHSPVKTSKDNTGNSVVSLNKIIEDGKKFLFGAQEKIDKGELQNFSKSIYGIAIEIGSALTVIVGLILGIKFIFASANEKAEIKKMLIVYTVGCFVVYGAFGIWRIVISILEVLE